MACSRQTHGVVASLSTILISILLLALERSVLSHFQHRLAKHSTAWPPHQLHPAEVKPLALVPEDLNTTPTKLVIACGALGLIAGIVGLFRTTNSPANNSYAARLSSYNHKPCRPYWTLAITSITALLSLASLIYTTVAEAKSLDFHYTDFTSKDQVFTRESWACQLAHYYPNDEWSDLSSTCWAAWSGRGLLIPLFLALIYQLGSAALITSTRTQHKRRVTMELGPRRTTDRKAAREDEDEGA